MGSMNLTDRLCHQQFSLVLKPEAYDELLESMSDIVGADPTLLSGEIILQFFISETHEELARPDSIHWIGIVYEYRFSGRRLAMSTKNAMYPTQAGDLLDLPEFRDRPYVVLQWSDIAWGNFDPYKNADQEQ